jgi:hypothetical protein
MIEETVPVPRVRARLIGCPILAALLFLRLGWDTSNP